MRVARRIQVTAINRRCSGPEDQWNVGYGVLFCMELGYSLARRGEYMS